MIVLKKILCLTLAAILAFSLSACGKRDDNTLNTTTKHNSIKFNKCSAFFNSYGNCVRDKDCVPDNDCVHDNNCVYDNKDSNIISKLKEYHEAGFIKKLL